MTLLLRGWCSATLVLGANALSSLTTEMLRLGVDAVSDFADTERVCRWDVEAGKVVCQEEEIREQVSSESMEDEEDSDDESEGEEEDSDDESEGEEEDSDDESEGEESHEDEAAERWLNDSWDYEHHGDNNHYADDDEIYERYKEYPGEGEEWDVWKHGDKYEIYNTLNCPEAYKDSSFENIHTTKTWQTFNRIYNEVIAGLQDDEKLKQHSTIPPKFEKSSFQFPIEVKFTEEVGRGVYAKTDIPEGSLLYVSTNTGAFFSGQGFRNFMKALPRELACDVSIWSYVRWVSLDTETNDAHMVCTDLDEGSFVNSADEIEEINAGLGNDDGVLYVDAKDEEVKRSMWYGCEMKFWTTKDIKAGDEIRTGYGDFAEADGWMYLGL